MAFSELRFFRVNYPKSMVNGSAHVGSSKIRYVNDVIVHSQETKIRVNVKGSPNVSGLLPQPPRIFKARLDIRPGGTW